MRPHFVKGSPEARAYMARLRGMRRGGNPPMLVMGANPGLPPGTSVGLSQRSRKVWWVFGLSGSWYIPFKSRRAAEEHAAKMGWIVTQAVPRNSPMLVMGGNPAPGYMGIPSTVAAASPAYNPASREAQRFISKKIGKLTREGYPPDQAAAIAYDMARRKGYRSVPRRAAGKKRRRNPGIAGVPPEVANDPRFIAELKAYRKRHGKGPVQVVKVRVPKGWPRYMTALGFAPEVKYDASMRSSKLGKRVHRFGDEGGKRPWLVSSVERGPKFLGFAGGSFEVGQDWIYK